MEAELAVSNPVFDQGIGSFSIDLYNESNRLATAANENDIMSPYSVCSALLLLTLGTARSTRNEIISHMFKKSVPLNIHLGYKTLHDKLVKKTSNENSLLMANRLFISNSFTVLKTFKDKAVEYYNGEAETLDFSRSEQSRQRINKWIETITKNKIRNMIPQGVLDSTTISVLTNAIYFKGTWKTQFNPDQTEKRNFFVSLKDIRKVDMMNGHFDAKSGYNSDLACKILQLPYVGETLSMVFLVPNTKDGLSELQNQLTFQKLNSLLSGLQKQDTIITIPKFKIESTFDLQEILKKLGIVKIFDPNFADFTNMVSQQLNDQGVRVSDARHKAFIEVTEKGSEAAAASTITVNVRSSKPKPFIFEANHPFLFVIRDDDTGTILFMGKYVQPKNAR